MRRRGQGEDARCAVPWKGATRRLMSRRRLGHAKARGRESPVHRASGVEPGDTTPTAPGTAAPLSQGAASPLGGPDKPTSGPYRRPPRARAGRSSFAAPAVRLRAGVQERPRERLAPLKLPRELRRPGSDRRSRAGRERRSSPTGTEARRPADPPNRRRAPGQDRNPPPPPDRDPREGTAAPGMLL